MESGPTRSDGVPFGATWSATFRRAEVAALAGWLELALAACDEADAIARAAFRRDLAISTKPDRTFVTQADTEIERAIRGRIRAAHPGHGLVGEEYGTDAGEAQIRWIIDPIDGTHNFMRGVPIFGTLLAVQVEGEVQVGVICGGSRSSARSSRSRSRARSRSG
jgi:histidinol-phosphatase